MASRLPRSTATSNRAPEPKPWQTSKQDVSGFWSRRTSLLAALISRNCLTWLILSCPMWQKIMYTALVAQRAPASKVTRYRWCASTRSSCCEILRNYFAQTSRRSIFQAMTLIRLSRQNLSRTDAMAGVIRAGAAAPVEAEADSAPPLPAADPAAATDLRERELTRAGAIAGPVNPAFPLVSAEKPQR